MKYSQAEKYIRDALWCVQHLRSIAEEDIIDGKPAMRAAVSHTIPWVFDEEKTLMHPLLTMVERMDKGGKIAGQEFYNIMFVIWKWAEIVSIKRMMSYQDPTMAFPEPDIKWLLGWEPE